MTNALAELRASLDKAVDLIDESLLLPIEHQASKSNLSLGVSQLEFSQASSLLEKCEKVEEQFRDSKPVLRVIHHLACSGGTLISKCLGVMPNTFILSEMHPTTQLHFGGDEARFTPTDFVMQARFGKFPKQEILASNVFLASTLAAEKHIRLNGGFLVIRDHTHSDYSTGSDIIAMPSIRSTLQDSFNIKSLLTIRDPIDSYLSLTKNGWLHFTPSSFDEYCRRFLVMTEHYADAKVCRYEDFVDEPIGFMLDVCDYWELPYSDYFSSIFDLSNVSGGSGRKSDVIQKMDRNDISDEIMQDIRASRNYEKISKKFKYGI